MPLDSIRHTKPARAGVAPMRLTVLAACAVTAASVLFPLISSAEPGAPEQSDNGDRWDRVASDAFDRSELASGAVNGWKGPWKLSQVEPGVLAPGSLGDAAGEAASSIEIRGTGRRNNPLRRQLAEPFVGDDLFVSFRIRYPGEAIDHAADATGEFFVLWLDDIDGSDGATHNPSVPNIGLHVAPNGPLAGRNVFMARLGSENTEFTRVEVEGDRTYRIVGRLSKSIPGVTSRFDRFEMWVDPKPDERDKPAAAVRSGRSVNMVSWLGFATGIKTERGDRIRVDDVVLGRTWESVLGLPAPERPSLKPLPPKQPIKPIAAADRIDFRNDVYPILRDRCFECHKGAEAEGGIRLDVREELLGHSTGQPLVVLGDAGASHLIQMVSTKDEDKRMPAKGRPLTAAQVDTLRRWIDQELAWDDSLLPPVPPTTDHWAYQPIERPVVPKVERADWVRNPIDAFIEARQVAVGTEPAPPADPRSLIRRATLDLTGLLPTAEEVDAFAANPSDEAYAALLDRLMKSTAHGERWGRHWLDLARWAESNGHQHNRPRLDAFRYRDYVVRAFANDMPYDRFLREQIAGDELTPYSDDQLIATGFLAAARLSGNELDKEIQRHDILADIVNNTAPAVLGLTFECAQCHNHKFDPISIRDYYRFYGFFVKGQPGEYLLRGETGRREAVAELIRERDAIFDKVHARMVAAKSKRIDGDVLVIPKAVVGGMNREERARYDELGRMIDRQPQTFSYFSPVTSPHVVPHKKMEIRWALDYEPATLAAAQPRLLIRGDLKTKGPTVDVGWPAVFGPVPVDAPIDERPRTVLADWMTSRTNPLTARVWANRVWQYHFGKPLVPTPSDFGVAGAEPTHPALLDWLASELVDSGWSTHHLHRIIMTSATYRQSAVSSPANVKADPEDITYWRWKPRRLESEAVRDILLQVSGRLDRTVGGPSVDAKQADSSTRRAIYQFQDRNFPSHMQTVFDGPNPIASCPIRGTSTVAPQPLFLLNSPFAMAQAEALADRLRKEAEGDEARIRLLYRTTLGREPEANESAAMLAFLEKAREQANGGDPLAQLTQVVLNLNEFVYIP